MVLTMDEALENHWRMFGKHLQRMIDDADITLSEFAARADITLVQASRIVNGQSGTRRATLPRFVQALHLSDSDQIVALYQKAGFVPPDLEEATSDINDEIKQAENAQRRVIADRIRYRREYLGYSQEEIATAVGLKRTTYAHYESGLNGVSSEILTKIARVLGCSADYLLGLDTETYDPDHTDLPPEFERIWGLHGKVMHAMPPGRARNAYMEQLRSMAEANLAILEDRLKREEEKTGEE